MKMLDYVKLANGRLRENLARGEELAAPLVRAYIESGCTSIRIVASGSSRNAAECARYYMQQVIGVPVFVVTPEAFCSFDFSLPAGAFNIVVSQSGYSTNYLAALDFAVRRSLPFAALTGNTDAPAASHVDAVIDYGVGVESVDFVTMGVQALIEFLMLFAVYAAANLGRFEEEGLSSRMSDLSAAIDAHRRALRISERFVLEHGLDLSRKAPTLFVGNGPNHGVVSEAALKFCETLKLPTAHYEGEEFIHGPEMQVDPSYRVFIIDDPEGSRRLRSIFEAMRTVSSSVYFVTAHPAEVEGELAMPGVEDPLTAAIPNLVPFQYISASIAESLGCWEVHPYLKAVEARFESKAEGYEESVRRLEDLASRAYGKSMP